MIAHSPRAKNLALARPSSDLGALLIGIGAVMLLVDALGPPAPKRSPSGGHSVLPAFASSPLQSSWELPSWRSGQAFSCSTLLT
jgi:hypothetical protein